MFNLTHFRMYFFAVAIGRKTGIYTSWSKCAAETKGYPHAVVRKFSNKSDAEAFLFQFRKKQPVTADYTPPEAPVIDERGYVSW
jgi:viroplasmin and RNaseH domain-containing protein